MDPELAGLAAELLAIAITRHKRTESCVEYDFAADEAFVVAQQSLAHGSEFPDAWKSTLRVAIATLNGLPVGAPPKTLMNAITQVAELAAQAAQKPKTN